MAIIKTLLADDHPIFLEGLKVFLSRFPDIQVEATAFDGDTVLQLLRQQRFDLLILDIDLPAKNGLEVLSAIQTMDDRPSVLVLSMYSEDEIVEVAIRRGADGYLVKDAQLKELLLAVEEVSNGGFYLDNRLQIDMPSFSLLQAEPDVSAQLRKRYALTKREAEVLSLIAMTRTNKQIGRLLNISDQTVGVHRKNILRKFGVHNTANLIRKVFEFERMN
ncbi:MAG: response regulator transcription factor [Bacteroidota bacterium]